MNLKATFKIGMILCLSLGVLSPAVFAELKLEQAVKKAIEHDPDVQYKWHDFLSSAQAVKGAESGYLPSVDLTADYGLESRNYIPNSEFSGFNTNLTVTQMLFDGFGTRYQVERFERVHLVRYFELLDAVERTTLEAFSAYLNVLRHRELVRLARNNFNEHERVFKQIDESAKAGVARRADLEQVTGRLALAESNYLTELSNLHDVSAQYLRLVGEVPQEDMALRELEVDLLPSGFGEVMRIAYRNNPAYLASLKNVEASNAELKIERAQNLPKVSLSASYGYRNYDDLGYSDDRQDGRIALELNYNFYSGGRIMANTERADQQVSLAKELRHKSCIEMRQELQIAFNGTQNLARKLPVLNQHQLSSNRVITAYRSQFDIGQRTLIDMLDAENEFFQSSRSLTNGKYDLKIAIARTLSGMGQLLNYLQINRDGLPDLHQMGIDPSQLGGEHACPVVDLSGIEELTP